MIDSIGFLIDRLVIENIKVFNLRQKLHTNKLNDEEYYKTHRKMNIINKNRAAIAEALDIKIENVKSGKEKNRVILLERTYDE